MRYRLIPEFSHCLISCRSLSWSAKKVLGNQIFLLQPTSFVLTPSMVPEKVGLSINTLSPWFTSMSMVWKTQTNKKGRHSVVLLYKNTTDEEEKTLPFRGLLELHKSYTSPSHPLQLVCRMWVDCEFLSGTLSTSLPGQEICKYSQSDSSSDTKNW